MSLLSALWESDEKPKDTQPKQKVDLQQQPTTPAPQVINAGTQYPIQNSAVPLNTPTVMGVVDDRFTPHFNDILKPENSTGIGYIHFLKQLEALNNLGLADSVKFQAALSGLKAAHPEATITKDSLIASAKEYVGLFDKDHETAEGLAQKKKGEQIDTRQEQINQLTKDIQALNDQIVAKTTEIANKQSEMIQMGAQIEQNRQNYNTSWNVYYQKIQNDINYINSFLLPDASATK